ncbi:MAG: hypothetical protein U0359_40480 [Byssovorax sp.]
MQRLAPLAFALALLSCTKPTPPKQVPEAMPVVPEEAASGAPSAARADIGASLDPGVPAAPSEPFPPVAGTLDGKPWELKGAGTTGPVQKDGTVTIAFGNYSIDCTAHEVAPEDRTITIKVPWQPKTKVDLAKLRSTEASAMGFDEKKKKPQAIRNFRPTGTLEVMSAPTGQKSSGRIKLDLTAGKDAIKAEIPVKFCFPE